MSALQAMSEPRTDNEAWSRVLVDELVLQGVRHAVICPGSRSTPLALALAERDGLTCHVVVDERAAAFFALGIAKGSKRPALLLCTSGTAGAHFLPAIIEASLTGVPLVVVTADRPPELHGFGASQSIDQTRLFGVWADFIELGTPTTTTLTASPTAVAALSHLRSLVARACGARGVTHMNAPFREPLAPPVAPLSGDDASDGVLPAAERARLAPLQRAARPRVHHRGARVAADDIVDDLARRLVAAERPVLVAGPLVDDDACAPLLALARAARIPVVAELGSSLRTVDASDVVVAHGELIARSLRVPTPDLVLRIGGTATTKALQALVDDAALVAPVVVIGAVDPNHRADLIDVDPAPLLQALGDRVWSTTTAAATTRSSPWLGWWKSRDAVCARLLADELGGLGGLGERNGLDEPAIARAVVGSVPAGAALVLASSMPIRDAETFGGVTADGVAVVVNRGAAGIDGLVSLTAGVGAGSGRALTLLCGDLALLHDLHGLVLARDRDVVVVVVNNDGGGIFSHLPVHARTSPTRFEQLFGTPHGLGFHDAAAFAGAQLFAAPTTLPALQAALVEARARGGLAVIEVRTDRADNVAAWAARLAAVKAALEAL